ncbi:mobile element protein [Vibrio ponticus]|nr:mobile element protein [Vibrio ponticus]
MFFASESDLGMPLLKRIRQSGLFDACVKSLEFNQVVITLVSKIQIVDKKKRRKYLLGLIKQFWLELGYVYGYRKIYSDLRLRLRYAGEICGVNQVHRLIKREGIQSQSGYRKPRPKGGVENIIVSNKLAREFNPHKLKQSWVTDITYIKTLEGWLYLAVVVDLFSRQVIDWSMKTRVTRELVLDVLLMAVWRRSPI